MKVGIVGLGSIGKRHANNATKLGHDVHVYDPAVKGDFRFRYERDLYDWCDAAVISTPTWVHIAGIRACAERGRHMLVEKPIAKSMATLREMLDFAASKNLTVMMGNNLRFHPCVQEAKRWLDAGYVGVPIWASFTCAQISKKYSEDGVVLNTGAHEVDLALHLFGPARVVSSYANALMADFVLEHAGGVRSIFHLDFVTVIEVRQFHIVGASGDIFCDLPSRELRRRMENDKLPGVVHEKGFVAIGSYDDDYLDEMAAFFDRIAGHTVPGATGEDGFATLDLLIEVRKKAGLE